MGILHICVYKGLHEKEIGTIFCNNVGVRTGESGVMGIHAENQHCTITLSCILFLSLYKNFTVSRKKMGLGVVEDKNLICRHPLFPSPSHLPFLWATLLWKYPFWIIHHSIVLRAVFYYTLSKTKACNGISEFFCLGSFWSCLFWTESSRNKTSSHTLCLFAYPSRMMLIG